MQIDLISREAVINAIYKMELSNWVKDDVEKIIRKLPSVQPSRPCDSCRHWEDRCTWLPSRKGHWIDHGRHIECDSCKTWFLKDHLFRNSFCPNCGADMREGSNDNETAIPF